MKRKFTAFVLVLVIALCALPQGVWAAPNLSDASAWAREYITQAVTRGIVPAELQSNYQRPITRQEFAVLAAAWLQYAAGHSIEFLAQQRGNAANERLFAAHGSGVFTDTSHSAVIAAFRLGIINGTRVPTETSRGEFSPHNNITRQEVAVMLMRTGVVAGMNTLAPAANFADGATLASWAVEGVNFVYHNNIMGGTGGGNFSGLANFTREQAIVTFFRIDTGALGAQFAGGIEQQVTQLVNAERASNGLPPLTRNDELDGAARAHSLDMHANNLTGATGSGGLNNAARMALLNVPMAHTGGHAFRFAVNIADITAEYIFQRIMSIAARVNNINREFATDMGLAIEIREISATRARVYVTQKFGAPRVTDHREFERQMFELINTERASRGLSTLVWNYELAAVIHRRIENGRSFSAQNLVASRIMTSSTQSAVNNESPASVFAHMMNNDAHRAQILRPDIISAGIGHAILPAAQEDRFRFSLAVFFATATEIPAIASPLHFHNALDAGQLPISSVTLQNRQQTPAEREAWIREYRETGGPSPFERAVLAEINRVRREHNLGTLTWDDELGMASRFFVQLAVDLDFPRRTMPTGTVPIHDFGPYGGSGGVARSFGVTNRRGGSASWGMVTPEAVVNQWMNSAPHRNHLLLPGITSAGIGTYPGGHEQHGSVTYFMPR